MAWPDTRVMPTAGRCFSNRAKTSRRTSARLMRNAFACGAGHGPPAGWGGGSRDGLQEQAGPGSRGEPGVFRLVKS